MEVRTTLHRSAIPFLVLAEPLAFFLFQSVDYCGPLCVQPTPTGIGTLGLVLVGMWLTAAAVTILATRTLELDAPWLDRLTNPRRPTLAILFALFGGYLFFLTLEATSVPGALWKPIVLPLSLLPFLPVWALYAVTYPLAIVVGLVGLEFSPAGTVLLRGVILFGGFGLAAIWQALLTSIVVEAIWSR